MELINKIIIIQSIYEPPIHSSSRRVTTNKTLIIQSNREKRQHIFNQETYSTYMILANTRSLLNVKTYILKFPIKPEVNLKRLASTTFCPVESKNMLL